MENLFRNFNSNNEHETNEANQEILERINNDPDFVQELFNFLEQTLSSDSSTFIKSICIVIDKMVEIKFKSEESLDFFLCEFIYNNIMEYVFVLPFGYRHFLTRPLYYFYKITDFSSSIIEICLEQLNSNSLINISTSIFIIVNLIITCLDQDRIEEAQQYYSQTIRFFVDFLFHLIGNFESISADQFTDDIKEEFELFAYAANSLVNLIYILFQKPHILNFIDSEHIFFNLVEGIIPLLLFDNLEYTIQTNICRFINSMIVNIFKNVSQFESEEEVLDIQEHFQQQILPNIIQASIQCLTMEKFHQTASTYLIRAIRTILKKGMYLEIINQDFINNIIIPLCYIQADDLQVFTDIPENFVAFYYCFEKDPNSISVRINVAKLLKSICKRNEDFIDMIISCCEPNYPENEDDLQSHLDYESRLFIISCILKFRPDDRNLFDFFINNVLQNDQPNYIIATELYALQFMTIEKEDLNMLSLEIIAQTDDPIICLFAVRLFNYTFNPQNPVFKNSLLINLLSNLMNLSNCVTYEEPITMLDRLTNIIPDLIEESASELVHVLFSIWGNKIEYVAEHNCIKFINTIIQILKKMPKNSQLYSDNAEDICEFFVFAITSIENPTEIQTYFEVINSLLLQTDDPNIIVFDIIPFLIEFIASDFDEYQYLMKYSIHLFINFVKKPSIFEYKDGFYVNVILEFTESIFEICSISTVSSILILYSVIIQVNGEMIDLALKSVEFFNQENLQNKLYVSEFVLFSSALLVDSESIIPSINEQILLNISNNLNILKETDENYISICLIGLCILGKNLDPQCLMDAYSVLVILSNARNENKEEDFLGYVQQADTFDDDFDVSSILDDTFYSELPSDRIDPYKFFMDISRETRFFETLKKEQRQEINQIIKGF